MSYARLTRLTRDDAQAARDARCLGKGLLQIDQPSTFLPTSAGYQPLNTGLHFRKTVPMILQFPQEVLDVVVAYVEPIWLFQLEDAYPSLAEYLSTQSANKIWYELLPAALMSEPEYHQDEREVEKNLKALRERGVDKLTFDRSSKHKVNGKDFYLTSVTRTWALSKTSIYGTIMLPQIDSVSVLSRYLNMPFTNAHPHNDTQYPMVTSEARPIRARILAIGGSYDQSINYRREIAGHLHTGKRCYLCFEGFATTSDGGFRDKVEDWDMYWCQGCLKQWTIPSEDIEKVIGLRSLLDKNEEDLEFKSLWWARLTDPTEVSWKPYVDAVLRKSIGIDFDIAIAKQEYMLQVSKSLTSVQKPITALRQALRRDIVHIAQGLSTSLAYDNVPANLAKRTFAKPTELSSFLFREGLLDEDRIFEPYDPNEAWLPDPTQGITSSKNVRRKLGDTTWKTQKATEMLDVLFDAQSLGGGVTAFNKAAEKYHIRRISNSVSANTTIEAINKEFPPQKSPFISSPAYTAPDGFHRIVCHLDVLLAKLYVYRGAFPTLPQLSAHELKLAKEVFFKKLVVQTCNSCPHTGLLVMPRGLEGLVRHYRKSHPDQFWESEEWTTIG